MTEPATHRLSVVVPAYHEADRIAATVRAIRDELVDIDKADDPGAAATAEVAARDGVRGLEIIVVDDGSGDRTADEALDAGADQVIVLPHNQGKGAAVRAGVLASRGATVAFTDADLAYHPAQLRRLLQALEGGADTVIGNRRHPDSELVATSGVRALGSRVVSRLASLILLSAPHDTQCGLKGFSAAAARDIFTSTRIDRFGFDIEVLYLVEHRGWKLAQIPVEMTDTGQRSTVRPISGARLIADLARIRYRAWRGIYDQPPPP